tara:strand:- start:5351 stop:5587 length:237 start_codon:yes stop_codon:yes gene_type:complete
VEKLLSNIKNGEHVIVRELKNSVFKVKMMEMGLIKGKKIEVLFRAPFGGPIAIDVDGYTLSLRKDEAALVLIDIQNDV